MKTSPTARAKLREIWTDPAHLATPLFVLWLDQYVVGEEPDEQQRVWDWDPETVALEIADDFQVVPARAVIDKVLAAREVVRTDRFFTRLPDFINVCNVLSGDTFDPTVFDPADAAECAWGITEALLLSPPDDDDHSPFDPEIVGYVAAVVAHEGLRDPPDVLRLGAPGGGPGGPPDPRAAQIRQVVRARLALLISQLEALPLTRGDTAKVVEKLLRAVPRAAPVP